MGAVAAEAKYSFAFEPVRALIDMTRRYNVGSVTLTLNGMNPIVVTDFPASFSSSIELVRPLLTSRSPICATGFDHEGGYIPVLQGKTRGVGKFLEVFYQGNVTRKAYWKPKVYLNNGQGLQLPETTRSITPAKLEELLGAKIVAFPLIVNPGQPTQVKFLFGPLDGVIDQQGKIDILKGDFKVDLKKVDWRLISATSEGSDIPLADHSPTFMFTKEFPGTYEIGGKGEFEVVPHELETPCSDVLSPPTVYIPVKGSVESLELIPDLPDHLEGIATVTSETTWEPYYKNDHCVWQKLNGRIETRPIAVGASSTISLKPIIGARLDNIPFRWSGKTNDNILSGQAAFSPVLVIPTPLIIGVYTLHLEPPGLQSIEIPNVYAVQKIDQNSNFKKIYFDRCISDSVEALKGKTNSADLKEIVDTFYDWWWNGSNTLKYYVANSVHTADVIYHGGGMCQGLGNYFYKAIECQGVAGEGSIARPRLRRVGFVLVKKNPLDRASSQRGLTLDLGEMRGRAYTSPYEPTTPEYWGGIIIKDPGLGRSVPVDKIPIIGSENAYSREKIRLQKLTIKKIPPTLATESDYVDFSDKGMDVLDLPCYCFNVAASFTDGHAFVVLEENLAYRLYDPSFGRNIYRGVEFEKNLTIAETANQFYLNEIISHPGKVLFPLLWSNYFSKSIFCWRSFTPCNILKILPPTRWGGMECTLFDRLATWSLKVVDARPQEINFLALGFGAYNSAEDQLKRR
ncbi:MAG: hypothetical protein HQM09_06900 [Candidatus Riflebacteria bacterium]|nr:hypothetical protein [Candidatus Riflebacteria bacterium]